MRVRRARVRACIVGADTTRSTFTAERVVGEMTGGDQVVAMGISYLVRSENPPPLLRHLTNSN